MERDKKTTLVTIRVSDSMRTLIDQRINQHQAAAPPGHVVTTADIVRECLFRCLTDDED